MASWMGVSASLQNAFEVVLPKLGSSWLGVVNAQGLQADILEVKKHFFKVYPTSFQLNHKLTIGSVHSLIMQTRHTTNAYKSVWIVFGLYGNEATKNTKRAQNLLMKVSFGTVGCSFFWHQVVDDGCFFFLMMPFRTSSKSFVHVTLRLRINFASKKLITSQA